jgi:hypothetical protein
VQVKERLMQQLASIDMVDLEARIDRILSIDPAADARLRSAASQPHLPQPLHSATAAGLGGSGVSFSRVAALASGGSAPAPAAGPSRPALAAVALPAASGGRDSAAKELFPTWPRVSNAHAVGGQQY